MESYWDHRPGELWVCRGRSSRLGSTWANRDADSYHLSFGSDCPLGRGTGSVIKKMGQTAKKKKNYQVGVKSIQKVLSILVTLIFFNFSIISK
jgi:hypothetical protein